MGDRVCQRDTTTCFMSSFTVELAGLWKALLLDNVPPTEPNHREWAELSFRKKAPPVV